MPATAGRVPMPPDNRIEGSRALETHAIWDTIGRDRLPSDDRSSLLTLEAERERLRSMTRMVSSSSGPKRGSCKKCNEDGHFTFQCRNFLNSDLSKPVDLDDSDGLDSLSDSSTSDSKERRRRRKSLKKHEKEEKKRKEKKRKRKHERRRDPEEHSKKRRDDRESSGSRKRERE